MELKIKIKDLQSTKGQKCLIEQLNNVSLTETARIRIAASINDIRKLDSNNQEKVDGE